MPTPRRIIPGDTHPIHAATETVPAGFPSPAADYGEPGIDLSAQIIDHPAATFMVRVAGDSMTGRGIDDGDELIVDRSLTARDDDVVVALVDGEFIVKMYRSGPPALLVPAKPDFPAIAFQAHEDAEIWGVVTTCLHHFRHR